MPKKGYKQTEEHRAKLSESMKGKKCKPFSEDHKAKLSESIKGKTRSEETKAKISAAKRGKPSGREGKTQSEEAKAKISAANSGENHPNYIDGRACDVYCQKWTNDFRANIREFFRQRCVICGKHQSEEHILLACHHVEYDKAACCKTGV
jgi:hypothetical protein